jgi:N-acetylmuramoyl-L-alanine amidase
MLQQIHLENNIPLINQFYSKTIKQRITMITKTQTSRRYVTLYLLFIPLLCMLLLAFSAAPDPTLPGKDSHTKDLVVIVDAGHGGQDAGAKTIEGITEKDLALIIAKKIQALGAKQGITIRMTRTNDEAMGLKARSAFANRFNADLFISLHINYDEHDASKSGIECLLSEKNSNFTRSKEVGDRVLNAFKNINGINVNGIKKGAALVLDESNVPAIILELGYLSNPDDASFLTKESNQELLSNRIINALKP